MESDRFSQYIEWLSDGGSETVKEVKGLSRREVEELIDYIGDFSRYEEIDVNGKTYLLVHGGLEPFDPRKDIEDYYIVELLYSRPDYNKMYYKDKYTITGHTPTITQEGNEGTIICKNHHIAIDCGCVYGYNLAVYCLETGETVYVKKGNV